MPVKTKWLAFYGDIPHLVNPVSDGCRVSLTFYINIADKTKNVNLKSRVKIPGHLTRKINETGTQILQRLNFASRNSFGLLLSHKYSYTEFQQGVYKGTDAYLLDHLKNYCDVSEVIPVFLTHNESWDLVLYGKGMDYLASQKVYRFTEHDIKVAANKMNNENNEEYDNFKPIEVEDLDFINLGSPALQMGKLSRQRFVAHCGNESREGFVAGKYFMLAVVLKRNDNTPVEDIETVIPKDKMITFDGVPRKSKDSMPTDEDWKSGQAWVDNKKVVSDENPMLCSDQLRHYLFGEKEIKYTDLLKRLGNNFGVSYGIQNYPPHIHSHSDLVTLMSYDDVYLKQFMSPVSGGSKFLQWSKFTTLLKHHLKHQD